LREQIISFFQQTFSPEVSTFIVSMLPIAELRGGIPLGLCFNSVSLPVTFAIAVVGNLVPIPAILLLLGPISDRLMKYRPCEVFFSWLFQRTRRKGKMIERFELVGLTLFVAIPLPVTGAWTGSAAAFLFGIPFVRAFPAIIVGVLIAGCVVTSVSLGLFAGLDWLVGFHCPGR